MEHDKMTVITEDGLRFGFYREGGKLKFVMFDGKCEYNKEVKEGSINAVLGKPLTFTYYYGYDSSEDASTEAPVIEIIYWYGF